MTTDSSSRPQNLTDMGAQLRNPGVHVGLVNEDNWREILRKNYVVLARIKTEHFVDELYQKCVLNEYDKDEIKSISSPRQRATYLIDLLECKGFSNFIIFLGILEIEYPDSFKDITDKEPMKKPGRRPRDRATLMIEVMPAMWKKLHNEMEQNESLRESLESVEQSIGFLKEEKSELEIEVERYRIELRGLPQLREDNEHLSKENEILNKANGEYLNRCLECVREKENSERRFRELKIQTNELEKLVEVTKLEKEKEKRMTKRWESICKQQKNSLVDPEIEILRETVRELEEKNQLLASDLWESQSSLTMTEEELRKAKKLEEALMNSEENGANLEKRCEDTRVQVDRLRKEKDSAIKSQQVYFEMYQNTSTERDRLSFQLRKLESQYDSTKKQLDKLKHDMRSSLNSEETNLSSSIHQWIDRLEGPSGFESGSSSGGSYSSSSTGAAERIGGRPCNGRMQRSDTVSPQIGERVAELEEDEETFNRKLIDDYDRVTLNLNTNTHQRRLCCVNRQDSSQEVYSSIGSEDGAHQDFYVRCDHDNLENTDGQLPYMTGDILLIINSNYDKKRDLWLAECVDKENGQLLVSGGQHQGTVKVPSNKDEKHVERRKNFPNDGSEKNSTINRRDAIRKGKSQEKDFFTVVTSVKVLYPRPVVILGPVSMINIVTAMVASNSDKYESWFNDNLTEIETRLVTLQEKTHHVILPPNCLKLCYEAKIHPICIYLSVTPKDNNEGFLLSVFGTSQETEQQNSINNLMDLKSSGVIYDMLEISRDLVPSKNDLVEKLIKLVHQLQEFVLWLPCDKSQSQSDH